MYKATNAEGGLLDVRFDYSEQLWPWSGYLALYIRVTAAGHETTGTAEGEVREPIHPAQTTGWTGTNETHKPAC